METIVLRERGSPVRIRSDSALLTWTQQLGPQLVERGYLGSLPIDGSTYVVPRQFVGRILANELQIEILPKSADVFIQLTRLADAFSIRESGIIDALSPGNQSVEITDAPGRFVAALKEAIATGIPKVYERAVRETLPLRGRLLFSDSVRRHWARGEGHRAVSVVRALDHEPRLAFIARRAAQALAALPFVPRATRDEVSELMSSVRVVEERRFDPETFDALRDEYDWHPPTVELINAAQLLLSGSRSLFESLHITAGSGLLCNTDRLWETAIARVAETFSPHCSAMLHPFGSIKPLLLDGGDLTINPDVGIYDEAGALAAIIDAKNSVASAPYSSDVYQILAYVTRLKAKIGIIAYLSASEWCRPLGTTANGSVLFAIGVQRKEVEYSLSRHLRSILADCC